MLCFSHGFKSEFEVVFTEQVVCANSLLHPCQGKYARAKHRQTARNLKFDFHFFLKLTVLEIPSKLLYFSKAIDMQIQQTL